MAKEKKQTFSSCTGKMRLIKQYPHVPFPRLLLKGNVLEHHGVDKKVTGETHTCFSSCGSLCAHQAGLWEPAPHGAGRPGSQDGPCWRFLGSHVSLGPQDNPVSQGQAFCFKVMTRNPGGRMVPPSRFTPHLLHRTLR